MAWRGDARIAPLTETAGQEKVNEEVRKYARDRCLFGVGDRRARNFLAMFLLATVCIDSDVERVQNKGLSLRSLRSVRFIRAVANIYSASRFN